MRPHLLVERLETRDLLSTSPGILTFTNTPLTLPTGASEPEISIGNDGTTAVVALDWLSRASNLWTGQFGTTPDSHGSIDTGRLQYPGRTVLGGGDVDVNIGSNGTIHATSLVRLVNPVRNNTQLGVAAINIDKNGVVENAQIIDTASADRPWITSDGPHVWISYHDPYQGALIHVQRSDDDGLTWHRVGDPIVGQDGATANATFNNTQGPIVADPVTHNLYTVYAAGEAGIQKATSIAL
jgi:hypothetical protein